MRITPKRSVIWASVTAYILLLFIGLGFALFQQMDGQNLGQIMAAKLEAEEESAILMAAKLEAEEEAAILRRKNAGLESRLWVYQQLLGEERSDGNIQDGNTQADP